MRGGQRLTAAATLGAIREHCREQLQALPPPLRQLEPTGPDSLFPVSVSAALQELAAATDAWLGL